MSTSHLDQGSPYGQRLEPFAHAPELIVPPDEALTRRVPPSVSIGSDQIATIARSVPGGSANIQDVYPLTPSQEGMLFHYLLSEREDTYVRVTLLELESRARAVALIAALQAVVDRHDILRTALLWEGLPAPLQVVQRKATIPVEELETPCGRELTAHLTDGQNGRLDLRRAPMMQIGLAPVPNTMRWRVLLRIHHLVADGQSHQTLIAEVLAHLLGRAEELADPRPYRDHVVRVLERGLACDADEFFKLKLGDVDEPTAPFKLLDGHSDGSAAQEARLTLKPGLAARAQAEARRARVTVGALFHSVWALVIAHASARDDVVYGTVLSGRFHVGSKDTRAKLGCFLNTLPLRVRLRDMTVRNLVAATQQELWDLLEYEQSSLVVAQRCSGIGGSTPLFGALLNYRQTVGLVVSDWSDIPGVRVLERAGSRTGYPIALVVEDTGEGTKLIAQTDPRIDAQRIVEYVATAMHSLVDALESAADAPALSLSILPEHERRLVINDFNSTMAECPADKLIHHLFEEWVERTPGAIALIDEAGSLTYAQLNAQANRLARYLIESGVGPDQRVGVCLERGSAMVACVLGILKAGGAYIPLDPTYPPDRLANIIADATPQIVLTHRQLAGALPPSAARVVAIDVLWPRLADAEDAGRLKVLDQPTAANLAYVIYTSGSSGEPKGVMVSHGNLMGSNLARLRFYGDTGRFLLLSAFGFDSSVAGLFGSLTSGGVLLVAAREAIHDSVVLARTIRELGVTTLLCVPNLYRSLLDCAQAGIDESALVRVIVAGEACPPGLISESAQRVPGVRIFNEYGPTEGTVWATVFACNSACAGDAVPIGRPIANARIYILDTRGEPVPIGVQGEIHIGGAGVARGYLNQPGLTADRFVPDPFSVEPGVRMYRTGDLGRWRADGCVEYLGRNDHQLKIRGVRIELGEIEAWLSQHPKLREAVVIVREDKPGDKRLVAYVTPRDGIKKEDIDAEKLRAYLKATLPEQMVPSASVVLERLPLTPNGKLDHRALPRPDLTARGEYAHEHPCGEIEEVLAEIWRELLGVERVGRRDNFLELGGHSLLVMRMMERLRRVGLSMNVREAFENPRLSDLALVLSRKPAGILEAPPNRIPSGCARIMPEMLPLLDLQEVHIRRIEQATPGGASNIQDIYPLGPLQEGILFHHMLDERGEDPYVYPTLFEVRCQGSLEAFTAALQSVIDRHDILRTAVLWERLPRPVQVVNRRACLPVEALSLTPDRDTVEQLKERMSPALQTLDLRRAPPMRLQVAKDAQSGRCYALLQLHHLICGGESRSIIIAETLAYLEGRGEQLSTPVQFREHIAHTLSRERAEEAASFFREKLGAVEKTTAPFGLSDIHLESGQIEEARETLEPRLAWRLRTQARRWGVSAATLIHAAWGLVVCRTSGQYDIVFGTVLSGRLHGGLGARRHLGMFVNTLPLRLRLNGLTVRAFVEQTQRELVQLLSHEQTSLAVARGCSGIGGSAPLFTALLNYRHSVVGGDAPAASDQIRVLASRYWTNYPVMLSVDDSEVAFELTAQTDHRVDPRFVNSCARSALGYLVDALENEPEMPVATLSVLAPEERHRILVLFNETQISIPSRLVHELFEDQAARTPGAMAAKHGEESLTYAELNARADDLAQYLREEGVAPGELVGVCMERGLRMIVGLLGILKAGGAYLPLDPNYPAERLRYMLEDAGPRIAIAEHKLARDLPATRTTWVAMDALPSEEKEQTSKSPATGKLGLSPGNLVYVIYTSGSTGLPKGSAMTHRAMINLIEWHRRELPCEGGQRVLQFAALSFDVAFQEIFTTLCGGGTLVMLDEWTRRDPRALADLLSRESIERLFVPPILLESLAEQCIASGAAPTSLRDIITAGEQLRITQHIARFFQTLGGCRLHNHYGPTESHVVTALTLGTDVESWPTLPSIGRPIPNAKIHVLDERLEPVPIGVAGEIYIGGAGVARGYLQRPELTVQRFIPDPFSADPSARLYRTGDLGRYQSDGTLEYLGRNDDQLKIRGFRVELGEIEAQLMKHPSVREAAVIVFEDDSGGKQVVAYVRPGDQAATTSKDLRAHLKEVLPEYMLPSAFVLIERLPQTPNGKLDRRALPAPDLDAWFHREAYEAPQGEIEEALAQMWRELLRSERIGRDDNFFELGGHSLLGMKLILKIAERLGAQPPVVTIFRYPTVREMARLVEELLTEVREKAISNTIEVEEGVL